MARVHECQALLTHARVLRLVAGLDATEAIATDLSEARSAIEEAGAHAWSPFLHDERAQFARLEADDPTWERELCEAHRLFVASGARGHAARVKSELV